MALRITSKRKPRPDLAARNAANAVHGGARLQRSAAYRSWQAMKQRIMDPADKDYRNYGGRGLDMDPRWINFVAFASDMGERPEGTTLDRKDNNVGYWPSNCRWAPAAVQSNNKRTNRFIEFNGRRMTVAEWSRELGVSRQTMRNRLESGWPLDMALTTPASYANRRTA